MMPMLPLLQTSMRMVFLFLWKKAATGYFHGMNNYTIEVMDQTFRHANDEQKANFSKVLISLKSELKPIRN